MEDTQKVRLVAFLAARLDEDEAAAKSAAGVAGPDWTWKTEVPEGRGEPTDYVTSTAGALLLDTMGGIESEAPFVARHDPARALREVEAKRATIKLREETSDPRFDDDQWNSGYDCAIRDALSHLAAVYSDHPDYDPDWKP